jgi:hypothetical protein
MDTQYRSCGQCKVWELKSTVLCMWLRSKAGAEGVKQCFVQLYLSLQ